MRATPVGHTAVQFFQEHTTLANRRSILSDSAATVLGTVVAALLAMAYVSLGARWLGPEGYAVVGANIAAANLFFLTLHPLEAGLTLAVARFRGDPALYSYSVRLLRGLLVVSLGLLALWLVAAPLLARWLSLGSAEASRWLGLFCCAALVTCGPRAVLRGREQFGWLAGNFVIESALRFGLGLMLLVLAGSPEAMLAGYGLGTALAVLPAAWRMLRGYPSTAPVPFARDELWLSLRSLSAPLIGLNLYTAVASNVDVLVANHYLDARQAGLYAGASSLSRMVPIAASPLLLVLFSRLASQSAAQQDTSRTLRVGALWVLVPLAGSLLVPALGGELLLRSLLGSAYREAQLVLLCQWATACVITAQLFFAESMLATSRVRAGWLFALPSLALVAALALYHDSALTIARLSLVTCATLGTLVCLVLARLRTR